QCREKVVTRDPGHRGNLPERVAKLLLAHAIDPLDLLLLTELLGAFGCLAPALRALPVLAGRVRTSFHRTLLGETLGALEKQLRPFAAALLAAGTRVPTHELRLSDAWADGNRYAGSA